MSNFDETIYKEIVVIGTDRRTVGELFEIELDDISYEFSTQASRYAFLGMQLARAEIAWQEAKTNVEKVYAEEDSRVRELWESSGMKFTEAKIKGAVQQSDRYQNMVAEELRALKDYKLLRAIVDAMRQRGEMLISLGAQLRQEYDVTGMSIRQTKEALNSRK